MKRTLLLSLTVFAALMLTGLRSAPQAQAQELAGKPLSMPDMQNSAFLPGEKLKFKLSYSGFLSAGEASFTVAPTLYTVSGSDCYRIEASGRTSSGFELFMRVRDTFQTYVDTKKLMPLMYRRVVNEGDFHFNDIVWFDHKQSKIKTGKKGQFQMEKLTHDLISSFYYARCLNLKSFKNGQSFDMPVFLDDKTYNLGLTVIGRETIKTELGKFRCIKVTPKLITGRVFKEDGEKMVLWVTDDDNYLPLRITSPLVVGSVRVDLVETSRLRNAMTSKVK